MSEKPTHGERLDAIERDLETVKGIFEKALGIPFVHPEEARLAEGQAQLVANNSGQEFPDQNVPAPPAEADEQ